MNNKRNSNILKFALFATGLSGIVTEYVLATLASYFLGDSIKQWTLIISLMLFFMGLGSRVTRNITGRLFTWFIGIEFALSFLVSFSALVTYSVAAFSEYTGVLIYVLSMMTGLLIGMEIPLAIRLNEEFEELKVNISGILEKDYYGSLLGGMFFAFVGLPFLGLTYTPFLLGIINLGVALVLLNFFQTKRDFTNKKLLNFIGIGLIAASAIGVTNAENIIFFGEQKKYKDRVVLSKQSAYQKIILTQWKENYWLYLNGHLQFSTFDEALYHEVLVHPARMLSRKPQDILILGGGDGCAARELLKYPQTGKITLVDLDSVMTNLGTHNTIFQEFNNKSLKHPNVNVQNGDGFLFLENTDAFYDLIIIDLPDPRSVELARLYSYEFYLLCRNRLRTNGVLVTQASSPYFSPKSFRCIEATMSEAGFTTLPLHNQILTMGEWGFMLGKKTEMTREELKKQFLDLNVDEIPTRWLNTEALPMIGSFGKDYFNKDLEDSIKVNRVHSPIINRYYEQGIWDHY